jgi:hypothetical protein
MIDDDLRDSDPAELAEVDLFGSDLEFPQHDSVQWLGRSRSYAALLGIPHERERLEREVEGH